MAIGIIPFNISIVCINLLFIAFFLFHYDSFLKTQVTTPGEKINLKENKNECLAGVKIYSSDVSSKHYYLCGKGEPELLECMEGKIYSPIKEKCVKENKGKRKKSIDALALGRVFELGNFYDARKNAFFPDASLWTKDTIDKKAEVNEHKEVNIAYTADKTAKEKMSHMDISASLSMDFLSGLIKVSGSAGYLRDHVDVDNEVNVEMRYHTTKYVKTLSRMVTKDYPQLCKKKDFTHVVTSVVYGLDAVFNFKRTVHNHESEEDIKGTLDISVTKIPSFSIHGKGSADLTDKEKNIINSTSLVMYGDFSPEEVLPTTFNEAINFFKELPLLTGTEENHWKGSSKLSLHMTPITDICDDVDYILNEISDSILSSTANILDKLEQLSMKTGGLLAKDPTLKFMPLRRNLILYSNSLENFRSNITMQLRELLPSIRGGNSSGENYIVKLIMAYRNSQFEFETSSMFLMNRNREIKAISMLTDNFPLRSNIAAIDYESANDVKFIFERKFVVVMKFNILTPKTLTENFLDGNVQDESDFWYNKADINGRVGFELKKYNDFALANVDMDDRGYLINLLPLKIEEPMSVVALIKGKVLSENFTIPVAPKLPQVLNITHNSFSIEISKNTDNKFISGFATIVQSVIDNSTIITEHDFPLESITTITGLKPAHPYFFSIRFLTRVGQTSPSQEQKYFITSPSSPPQNLKAKNITSSSMVFTWAPPAVLGDGIREEDLEYCIRLAGEDGLVLDITTPKTEASFEGLSDATSYNIEIRARVVANKTTPVSESLPDMIHSIYASPLPPTMIPSLPTEVMQHAITVRWEQPTKLGHKAKVIHYVLEYNPMNENGSETIPGTKHQLIVNNTFCLVTGLAQGQLYLFKANIKTDLGESGFGNSIIQRTKFNQTKYDGLVESLTPLGSIIPWTGEHNTGTDVPTGWQKCDGSLIEQGPLAGQFTPDLNGKELFIRGGSDKDAGKIEADAVDDHKHEDPGHTHTDSGHTHTQQEHDHQIDGSGNDYGGFVRASSCASRQTQLYHELYECSGKSYCVNFNWHTAKSTSYIHTSRASIKASKAGVGWVSGGKSASETRPKNMRLVYIMRVL